MISVIIPLESKSRYCVPALESIISQGEEALEICIIPVAGDESVPDFAEEIARGREVVSVLPLCRNMAEAVNLGVSSARGEYIHICTGREILQPGTYAAALRQMAEADADAACFGWEDHTGAHMCAAAFSGSGNRQAFLELILTDPAAPGEFSGYGTQLWNKIFRRRVFFLEGTLIPASEEAFDMMEPVWLCHLAVQCEKAVFLSDSLLKRQTPPVVREDVDTLDIPAFHEQQRRALAFAETISPYAYKLMLQLFFAGEISLLLRLRERRLVKAAAAVESYLADYYGVPYDENQVIQTYIRVMHQQKSMDGLRRDISKESKKVLELTDQTEKLKADRTFLQKQRESQAKKIEDLTADRTFLQKQRESQAKKIEGLTADRTFLQKQRESQAKKIESLTADRTFLQKQRESQAKKIEDLTADRILLQMQREEQDKRIEGLEADKADLKRTNQTQSRDIAFLQADLAEMRYQNEDLSLALAEFQGSFLARTALKLNRIYRKITGFFRFLFGKKK